MADVTFIARGRAGPLDAREKIAALIGID